MLMTGCPATNTNDDDTPLASIEVEDPLASNEAIDIGAGILDPWDEAVKVLDSSSILDELMGESESNNDKEECEAVLMDVPSAEARIAMLKKNITPPAVPSTDSKPDDNDDDVCDPD